MIFKRRDPKPFLRALAEVKHRVRRLPDTPERIARGIWAGVFTTFTPFYGLHFVVAALVGKAMRGNLLAALMATFFGNPLTYVPIGIASLKTGHWLLGTRMDPEEHRSFGGKFYDAAADLWDNLIAVVQGDPTNWTGLDRFFHDVFFPYLVGGIIPGIICGTIAYYISVPLLRAYQKRRKGAIKAKFEALKAKAAEKAAAKAASKSEARSEQE